MLTNKRQFLRAVNLHIFYKMSMKENWVTFESFVGRNYSGQPKYVYQYMQKVYGDKYKYIWIVDNALEYQRVAKRNKNAIKNVANSISFLPVLLF